MSLLQPGGTNYIGAHDIAAATKWYIEKLGLRKIEVEQDDCPECITLGLSKDQYAITLGSPGRPTDELTPMLYTANVRKAREFLSSRGVRVGEIQQDRQGTLYFEMQDLEGNVIEITEEP
jgi:catechol 2,3-dioxygenase-like lactoylglutathione lyase family enzyme